MKTALNLIRAAIFMVVIYYFMAAIIIAFNWLSTQLFDVSYYGQEHLGAFTFWLLVIFAGGTLLGALWYGFKFIMGFILSLLAIICPYQKFAVWYTGIVAAIYCILYLIGFWFGSANWSVLAVIIGIVMTICCGELCFMSVMSILIRYEAMYEAEMPIRGD